MSYGEAAYKRAVAWRDAALADGWTSKPTYDKEAEERASTLTKDNFEAQLITRTPEPKPWNSHPKHEGNVNIWGPDHLAIDITLLYDWQYIVTGLRRCLNCKTENVETQRVSFAGRVCRICLPAMQKKHEYPGWAN